LEDLARAQAKGARLLALGGINDFLRIHAAGNKSGALLLTIRALINRRGDGRFTRRRAANAVHDGEWPDWRSMPKAKNCGATGSGFARVALSKISRPR
jgi:hypothetical protein